MHAFPFFSFVCAQEVVYVRPPKELEGRHREAVEEYLRQLPRMHNLLSEPHKLVRIVAATAAATAAAVAWAAAAASAAGVAASLLLNWSFLR